MVDTKVKGEYIGKIYEIERELHKIKDLEGEEVKELREKMFKRIDLYEVLANIRKRKRGNSMGCESRKQRLISGTVTCIEGRDIDSCSKNKN